MGKLLLLCIFLIQGVTDKPWLESLSFHRVGPKPTWRHEFSLPLSWLEFFSFSWFWSQSILSLNRIFFFFLFCRILLLAQKTIVSVGLQWCFLLFLKGKVVIYKLTCLEYFLFRYFFFDIFLYSANDAASRARLRVYMSQKFRAVLCFLFVPFVFFFRYSSVSGRTFSFCSFIRFHSGNGLPTSDRWQQFVTFLAGVPVFSTFFEVINPDHCHRPGHPGSRTWPDRGPRAGHRLRSDVRVARGGQPAGARELCCQRLRAVRFEADGSVSHFTGLSGNPSHTLPEIYFVGIVLIVQDQFY